MDKVTISNLQGENGLVNVVRYFNNNGSEILIYSLNEVDEAGYTRLYVTKLNGVDGTYTADTLNDNEWNEIKNLIKTIVKSNKEGMPVPVQDLNPQKIKNVLLKEKKVFKLNASLVNDLSANKKVFDEVNENAATQKQQNTAPVQPTFDVPSAPTFETPVQPTFDVPSAPTFETPVQSTFDVPSTPTFETPVQPTFDFNMNMSQPINNSIDNTSSNDDYKEKYESELKKNEKLENQINQYINIINNIKDLLNK